MALTSCAKNLSTGTNDSAKRQFDAWLTINGYDGLERTSLGSAILEKTDGDASRPVGSKSENLYVIADFTIRDLYTGKVTANTRRQIAIQTGDSYTGDYDSTAYYGPQVRRMYDNYEYAGLEEIICSMNVGSRTKAFIPGWLMTKKRYKDAAAYISEATGTASMVDIEVVDKVTDIKKWEIDSLSSFLRNNYPEVNAADTVSAAINKYGLYFIQTGKPASDKAFGNDTTFYVNYTGRLLNGQIFDTNMKNVAKDAGIWKSSREYAPAAIKMNEDISKITMDGSNVIYGFYYPLSKMHPFEKATVIFYSAYGYQNSGSGNKIPPYSPLRFDLEVVSKP